MKHFIFSFLIVLLIINNIYAKSTLPNETLLFTSFKQGTVKIESTVRRIGGGGNCASVALIKAAIGTFGLNKVFHEVKTDSTKKVFLIELRDGQKIDLSFDRAKYAAKKSAFKYTGNSEIEEQIFEYAKFCFAVMARVKQIKFGYKKYFKAVDDLNKGDQTSDIHIYLGLQKVNVTSIELEELKNYKHIVLWNAPHAVYSSEGFYDEFFIGFDQIQPLNKLQVIHGNGKDDYKPLGAYQLK